MPKLLGKLLIWLLGATLLAVAFGLAVLQEYKSPDSRLWASPVGYPSIARRFGWEIPAKVATAEMQEVEPSISAEGRLRYRKILPVPLEMPGIVQSVLVKVGGRVKRGDVLFVVDKGGARVDLARLDVELKRAAFVAATESLERTQQLRDEGLVTYDALYDYESEQRYAAQALTAAEESLRLALFTRSELLLSGGDADDPAFKDNLISGLAPIDGIVGSIGLVEGQTVMSTATTALTIADDLQFVAFLDQGHFGKVKSGQMGTLYLMANSSAAIGVTVSHVEPFVSGIARRSSEQPPLTFIVWFSVNDGQIEPDNLAEGMTGYVIMSQPRRQLVIPSKALLRYSGGEGVVMTLDAENKVTLRKVSFTWSDGTNVGISEGLQLDERVVVGGQIALVQGDVVDPVE